MGRKNKRISDDLYLPPIKDERRPVPRCDKFSWKTVFITAYGAQVAIDEIRARSDRDKTPIRVYDCNITDGGCGYFHITSQDDFKENRNGLSNSYSSVGAIDYRRDFVSDDDSGIADYGF